MIKRNKFIILLAILLILIGIYFYLDKQDEIAVDISEDNEIIKISDFNINDVDKVFLQSQEDTLTIIQENGYFSIEGYEEIDFEQRKIRNIVTSAVSLEAINVFDIAEEELVNFGLKDPALIIKTIVNGQEKTLYLGDKVIAGNRYYLKKEGDDKVYTIQGFHGDRFQSTISDLRSDILAEINPHDLTYLLINHQDQRPIEIKVDDLEAEYVFFKWRLTKPYQSVKRVAVNNLIEQDPQMQQMQPNLTFRIRETIEDVEDLSLYGFNKDSTELIIRDSQNTVHLIIGEAKNETEIYVKTPDSNTVYTISKNRIKFMELKPFAWANNFVLIMMIDQVKEIIITGPDFEHKLAINRTLTDEGEKEEVFMLNQKEVAERDFRSFYGRFIGLTLDAEIDQNIDIKAKPKLSTTFIYQEEEEEIIIDYLPYNRDFYAVSIDGFVEFLINQEKVEFMLEELNKLMIDNQ